MGGQSALVRIDEIADENLLATVEGGKMSRAIMIADRMTELRKLLTEKVLEGVAGLAGTDIGFRTDKDNKGGYEMDVIRDVTIEATLRGYRMIGNEVNVIAGRFYATRNGLERKVREFPGLRDLKLTAGVPHKMSEGALVEYHAEWKLNGTEDRIDCQQDGPSDTRIAVRVNAGMGTDAILGKAERKMLARIYTRLTGSAQSAGEAEEEPDEIAEAEIVDATPGESPESPDAEAAVIQAQEAIDMCTSAKNVNEALKEFTQGMSNEDVDLVSQHALRKIEQLRMKQ